ncbi:Molybdenum cofactor synthesis protein [Schistosoma japonicum]|uniref:molybdopterin adenylyltransferase n=2 Tax=Schistosoma japonicum TaxID=6182 RepID=A0A4Z2CM47_SCHJA|nr:Molybdenum cofactor synthesis protein [Schistosoma japonicum]
MTYREATDPRLSVAVLTVSDTCSKDMFLDQSGSVAESLFQEAGFDVPLRDCVPDDPYVIRCVIMRWIASRQVEAVFTLGGTGLSRRDVTSDIILELVPTNQRLHGVEHSLYSISLRSTPMGALSRFVAGVCNETLLITLPGSASAVSQCIPAILPIMKHAIHQIKGWDYLVKQKHPTEYNVDKNESKSEDPSFMNTVVSRCRQSRYPMISVDEALSKIFTVCDFEMGIEAVFHRSALGRVLGLSLKTRQCVPPFDASIMDGYAIRFTDGAGQLKVVGTLCAGDYARASKELVVTPGTCVRVNTGGPIPPGADCVVPVENTKLISTRKNEQKGEYFEVEDVVEVIVSPEYIGQFIRPAGFDLNRTNVFRRGLRLGSAELGLISSSGLLTPWPTDYADYIEENKDSIPNTVLDRLLRGGYIPCLQQCRIGVLSTGNEIIDSVVPEVNSCVRDSNRPVLINLLYKHNYYNVLDCGILADDRKSLSLGLSRALASCDILITTGGVSMGERDIVSQTLIENFGATLHFGRVFMKPGKPTTFLSVPRNNVTVAGSATTNRQPVLTFCLPGNPVSCYVTAHIFVLPVLRKLDLRPRDEWCFPSISVRLLHPVKLSDRPDYRRARLVWKQNSESNQPSVPCASCDLMGSQMSSRLASCLDSNLLLVLPPIVDEKLQEIPIDSVVNALVIDSIY